MDSLRYNIPNVLSILRIIMIIPFSYSLLYDDMVGVTLVAITIVASDYFDGYLARRWDAVSELGKILDPLADKLCVAGAGVLLVFLRGFPLLLVVVIIIRDIAIVLGGLYILRKDQPIPVSNMSGKITVGAFAGCLAIYLYGLNVLKTPAVIFTVLMIVVSSASYGLMLYNAVRARRG